MLAAARLKEPCDGEHRSRNQSPDRSLACCVEPGVAFERLRDTNDRECSSEHSEETLDPEGRTHRIARLMIAHDADVCKWRSSIGVPVSSGFEQMLEEPLRRIEKVTRNQEMLRLAIFDLLDGVSVETEQDGPWVAQEDRRMRQR